MTPETALAILMIRKPTLSQLCGHSPQELAAFEARRARLRELRFEFSPPTL